MKAKPALVAGIITSITLMTTAACGGGDGSSSSDPTKVAGQTVRILQAGGADFSSGDVMKAIELLKAQGIKVKLNSLDDPATALRATIAGQDDVYMDAPNVVATAVANSGADVKYVGTLYQSSAYDLLAKPGVTLDDLSGKSMAISAPGVAGTVSADAALTKSGIDIKSIHHVIVGGTSARVTAILAGKVDVAPALAPSAIAAEATGKVKIIMNTGQVLGPFLQQGLIANGDFLKRTALAQAVITAFIQAERFSSTDETGYIAIANKYKLQGDLTADQEKQAWEEMKKSNLWATNGGLCQSDIDATLKYDYDAKALDESKMPKQSAWIDTSFVQKFLTSDNKTADTC